MVIGLRDMAGEGVSIVSGISVGDRDPDKLSWGIPKGFSVGGDSEFSSWHYYICRVDPVGKSSKGMSVCGLFYIKQY